MKIEKIEFLFDSAKPTSFLKNYYGFEILYYHCNKIPKRTIAKKKQ